MAARETLTIELPPDAARLVQEAVSSGAFATPDDMVAAVLHGWKSQQDDDLLGYTLDELRKLGDEGQASGPGRMTLAQIQEEGLRRAGVSNAGE